MQGAKHLAVHVAPPHPESGARRDTAVRTATRYGTPRRAIVMSLWHAQTHYKTGSRNRPYPESRDLGQTDGFLVQHWCRLLDNSASTGKPVNAPRGRVEL
jgi:hypothetical protein